MRISDWVQTCALPITILTGVAVVIGYALLGASWLVWKTEGSGQAHARRLTRSEEHTSELQSLMRISYAVFCLKKKKKRQITQQNRFISIHKPTITTYKYILTTQQHTSKYKDL